MGRAFVPYRAEEEPFFESKSVPARSKGLPPATPEVVESGRPTLFLVLIVSGYASDVRSGKGSRRRQHEGPYLPPVESRISQCEVEHQCNTKGTHLRIVPPQEFFLFRVVKQTIEAAEHESCLVTFVSRNPLSIIRRIQNSTTTPRLTWKKKLDLSSIVQDMCAKPLELEHPLGTSALRAIFAVFSIIIIRI